MPELLGCPPAETWKALFEERLSPEQREQCERHLDSCSVCQGRLERASSHSDALVG
jgi:hypothetical protein